MSDVPRDPSLETVFAAHRNGVLQSMLGCLPGVIVSYDAATGSASVQPSIMEASIGEGDTRVAAPMPVINDVPVWAFGTAQVRIKLPLTAGDPVLIVWAGRSLQTWKQTSGGTVDPGDDAAFDYNECFCFPGRPSLSSYSQSSAQIEFTANTVQIGGSNPLVTKSDFDAHLHTSVSGGGPTSIPTVLATGTAVLRA